MPILFYREAFHAACHDAPPAEINKLTDAHFETTVDCLEEALAWLTPEQLCDALYGDWLLHLHNPGGEIHLQVRNLLIQSGALAATYLAELAQNADDAYDGKGDAEVRLLVDGDWLLVANNGRRVTPGNLRGLSRFFVHRGGKVRELDAETIGRFGIGFKSCYRIASEVLVRSWDAHGETVFRLPISKEDEPHSLPEETRLHRVAKRLTEAGAPVSAEMLTADKLGYCTPEFLPLLPADVPASAAALQKSVRGTFFAFRLHSAGAAEVRSRISGQEHELYELCPLFLPKVRTVQLGGSELTMRVGREDASDGLPGSISAARVTLETKRGSEATRDRFWKLTGIAAGDHWQIALHADSKWLLNFKNDDDAVFSLQQGGAYAFFPLNDANRDFLFRFHLHLDLPTDLKRGDWNDQEHENVRTQIGRAIEALAEWLETHSAKRHADWQIEGLFREEPREGAVWSHEIFKRLKLALQERPLLRTLWGGWCRSPDALAVRLSSSSTVRRSWRELCTAAGHVGDHFPFVETGGKIDLGIPAANSDQLRAFFAAAAEHPNPTPDFWRNMLHSILGAEDLAPKQIEEALGRVPVELDSGGLATVAQLMQRSDGAELVDAWHAAFRSAAQWLREDSRKTMSIFGESLVAKLNRLGTARFSVEWHELPEKFTTLDDWVEHGERFWTMRRQFCPTEFREEAVATIRVKHGADQWQALSQVWLADTSSVRCFASVVRSWDKGGALNFDAQTRIREKLKEWGLWETYLSTVEERLEEDLASRFVETFEKNAEQPLAFLCEPAHRNSRNNLQPRWQRLVSAAEREALQTFLRRNRAPGAVYLSRRNADIPFELRCVLTTVLPGYSESPVWLNTETWALILQHSLQEDAGFQFLSEITAERRSELAQEILRRFWRWKDKPQLGIGGERMLVALDGLFADVRGTWTIGLASNRTAILNQLFVHTRMDIGSPADQAWQYTITHAGKVEWHIDFLPELLTNLPRVASVCLSPSSLRLEPPGASRAIPVDRVSPEIRSLPGMTALLATRAWRIESISQLNLHWKAPGVPVCEIRNATFAFHGDCFLVAREASAPDEDQYIRLLTTYELHAPEDREFKKATKEGKTAEQVYNVFRDRIVGVLRDRLVIDEGYEERHVLRELLQNAESAYASRAGEPLSVCPFHVRTEPAGNNIHVVASHCGRAFNEPDAQGEARYDIARIVSLRADKRNTAEEIGRFNRGFKSVFTVTNIVQVRSGAYDFGIEDLLLLHPPEPEPQAELVPETRFLFKCNRTDAQKLFGNAGARNFSIFHVASFVFLKYVNEITLEHGGERRQWAIQRSSVGDGWSEVVIEESSTGEREQFLVFAGISTRAEGRRFGVAIRLGIDKSPIELDPAWNRLSLTFPTETSGPCGVLINADFDIDTGRVEMRRSKVNESLIKDAFDIVLDRLRDRVRAGMPRAEWLGWARVISVSNAQKWVAGNFPGNPFKIREQLEACGQELLQCLPHDGDLDAPSRLMRELAGNPYAADWGIKGDSWLDSELEAELMKIDPEARVRFSLRDFAWTLQEDTARGVRVLADLQSPQFTQMFKLNAVDTNEWREAVNLLTKFQEAARMPILPPVQTRFDFERIDPSDVIAWWRENDDPEDYTLDSEVLWPLFGPAGLGTNERRALLVNGLSSPATIQGQRLWYQVLGFACLMSAGWPVERVRRFWIEKLAPMNFWEQTENGFREADSIFDKVIHEEARGSNAASEDATFWRRIFYDVRKLQHLVYVNQFAEEVMGIATDPHNATHLLRFLKTGKLPGERAWRGVLGQSAGSPLFFVVRELRRLGVITPPEVDGSAFFVCTPVRRLAARLGWIESKLAESYDFESLGEASQRIHAAAMELDQDDAAVFREWFDIPLLHYALNHP